jgi:hypothetical protein
VRKGNEKKKKKRSPSVSSFENGLNGLIFQLVHWWVLGHRGHAKQKSFVSCCLFLYLLFYSRVCLLVTCVCCSLLTTLFTPLFLHIYSKVLLLETWLDYLWTRLLSKEMIWNILSICNISTTIDRRWPRSCPIH